MSALPPPQVLAGFVRTFLLERAGADFHKMRGRRGVDEAFQVAGVPWLSDVRVRGPFLAEVSGGDPRPLVRTPADLDGTTRLRPLKSPPPGWDPPKEGMLPLWREGKRSGKDRHEFLDWAGLRAYLNDARIAPDSLRRSSDLYLLEERTGIGIDPATWAAKDELIYTTRSLRLKRGVAFYGEVTLPDPAAELWPEECVAPWGGERHHVRVTRVRPVSWPEMAGSARTALLLASPAPQSGWLPGAVEAAGVLRAAAVDGPFAVSGWDYANGGPKPTRFGVEAGSVYLVEGNGAPPTLAGEPEDGRCGYGFYLKGTWAYAG